MTGVQRSFLFLGLGLGLMVAALMLYLQTALQQAVQVPGATGIPRAPVTSPVAPAGSQPTPPAGQTASPAATPAAGQTASPAATPAAGQAAPAAAPVPFVVREGQDLGTVAQGLHEAKLIADADAFVAKAKGSNWAARLQVGTYSFKPGTPEDAILQELITVK